VAEPNRLAASLANAHERSERGLAPYVTAGDGGPDTTLAVLRALAQVRGVACVELGVPFSDPIADGPVLQAANERALAAGTTFEVVLGILARFRAERELPVAVMTYANPIVRRGAERACRAIAQAGGDGLLVADLPVEESAEIAQPALAHGLCPISFVSPTTSDERMQLAAGASRGFLYAIGRFGVTGAVAGAPNAAAAPEPSDAGSRSNESSESFLRRVRHAAGELPVAVGFGISSAQHVAAATRDADLAIVGSALVQRVHDAFERGGRRPEAAADAARAFAEDLCRGLTA